MVFALRLLTVTAALVLGVRLMGCASISPRGLLRLEADDGRLIGVDVVSVFRVPSAFILRHRGAVGCCCAWHEPDPLRRPSEP